MAMHSKLSADPIRFFLLADAAADLFQLVAYSGNSMATCPEMPARQIMLSSNATRETGTCGPFKYGHPVT